ncbi:MAG: signal peptide peptidase SppA [Acidobacteriota bacterium]|nr:signal peptide peptidase SppA [Acidobacteriota bacterium]
MRARGKAVLLLLLVLLVLALVVVVSMVLVLGGESRVSSPTILELDLQQSFPEDVPDGAFARSLLDGRLRLRRVVETLERAARDEDVVAIVARVGAAPMGLATAQELRDAMLSFRAGGKKAVAYADTFGEWGPSNAGYYLATAFEEIHLQPSGDVGLSGLRYEIPFVADALDKLGLDAQMDGRHEYKNAINTYTRTGFTEPHEEAMQALVDSQFEQLVRGIAEGRSLDPERVRTIFDQGPYFGAEALDAGLVDRVAYRDEVYTALEEEFGEDVALVELREYARRGWGSLERSPTVALIYGVGGVVRGESHYDPFSGPLMGSETVAGAFRDAIEDPKVRAILFRVDSPGGSYIASDTIWRETIRARDAGKPVVVSMGNLAASGGYFVAMSADRIVAQPGTITGSIGVYGGKIVTRGLWDKLGVSWDSVETSANARMWSSIEEFGDRGWDRVQDSLDRIYGDFVDKVATGRGLSREEAERVARGRVWTGEKALELGLVDVLGGYPTALAEIRQALGLDDEETLKLKIFPRPRSTFELLLDRLPAAGAADPSSRLVSRWLEITERLGWIVRSLGLDEGGHLPLRAHDLQESK